jgi:CPA2 family monovalent cation:H+ antiporter-2
MEATAAGILDAGVILALAALAGFLARKLGLPAILGYLAVGLIVSPFTPGYVANRQQLEVLADVGVVLLLFEVGVEIDPIRLGRDQRRLLMVVPIQIAVTTAMSYGALTLAGVAGPGALLVGIAVAMSSSVVVVNITRSRRRTTSPQTNAALLTWSVIQDLVGTAISLVALAALGFSGSPTWLTLLRMVIFVVGALAVAWLVPRLLRHVLGQSDIFLVTSVAGALLIAGAGARFLGIPLALAAFVGGLVIAESPEATAVRRALLPFRDLFAVMFFVALGTLIDPAALRDALPWIGIILALVFFTKVASVVLLAPLAVPATVNRLQLGAGLGQVGEFSFVLGSLSLTHGAVTGSLFTALLSAVVVTVAASSTLVGLGRRSPPPG